MLVGGVLKGYTKGSLDEVDHTGGDKDGVKYQDQQPSLVTVLALSGGSVAENLGITNSSVSSLEGKPIIAAYFFLFDGAYDEAMSVQDSIPWKKINRLYIAFATVDDGVLTDKTTSDSSIEETEQKR